MDVPRNPAMIRPIGAQELMRKWIARRPLFAGLSGERVLREYGVQPSDALAAAAE